MTKRFREISEVFSLKGLNVGLVLLLTLVINKYFSVDDAALFFTSLNLVLILSTTSAMGLEFQFFMNGGGQDKADHIQNNSILFFIVKIFFQVALVVTFVLVAFNKVESGLWLVTASSVFVFSINLVYAEFLRSVGKPNQQIISNGLVFYLILLTTIMVIYVSKATINLNYTILLSTILVFIYHFIFKFDDIVGFSIVAKKILRKTKEQASFMIYSWLVLVLPQLPLIIIALSEDSQEIVTFNLVVKLASFYGLPIVVLTARYFPGMKRMYQQGNINEFKDKYLFILKLSTFLTILGFIFSYVLLNNQFVSETLNIYWSVGFLIMFFAYFISALSGPNILTLLFCFGRRYAILSSATALLPIVVFVLYGFSVTSINLILLTACMIIFSNIVGSVYVYRFIVKNKGL